jgi:toxin ParE1/3/4
MACYYLRPAAIKDLESIWKYTLDNWGIVQADQYVDALTINFQLLSDNPLIAPERIEFTPSVRIHHHAHHLIVFRLIDVDIEIIRVLHESMALETKL